MLAASRLVWITALTTVLIAPAVLAESPASAEGARRVDPRPAPLDAVVHLTDQVFQRWVGEESGGVEL